ncbi:hypothetical protein N7491_002806 [Penicillium cf. griseofulvum]|uniref:Uncharacterized protein n=1 Tax=Penicillium cf. griseofulvum TaxID=2972120 RepID=A0A9W9MSA0_9EURO|nr:hypothetical protein N7472_003027 [Penicillium cf. griseofulvum]KAJ5440400.1 hypothetical protein N7491_002806 [Penicillium cf. griseofulvum]KAJ5448447.1 hypothetical protein N7445_003268 [Penicillium cf. griseofulvum]
MAEETRWCYTCNKGKPQDSFRAPEGIGKDFYKLCEACRIKFRNRSRAKRAKGDRERDRPYYLPDEAPQTNQHPSNLETGPTSPSTSAAPTNAMPDQSKHLHAGFGHRSWVTVAPPVVESSAQSTTTTTVITFSTTTISKNVTGTPPESEEDTRSTQHHHQEVRDEDLESISSGVGCRPQSEIGESTDQRPEFFGCLHCENLRPWPMAALHICLLCIRDWKWCAKGAHNQAKANFLWDGVEHDECYVCHFADV